MMRYHMQNNELWIMVEHTDRKALERIRQTDPRFKGRHIKHIWQCYPSQIEVGRVYQMS